MFKFDIDQFKAFYQKHAKNMDYYDVNLAEAKAVMGAIDPNVFRPQFILTPHYTKSGNAEFYFQEPVSIEVKDLTIHHPGYDYIIIDNGKITYHETSLESVLYAMQVVKDYEANGQYDEIQHIKAGKITGNVIDLNQSLTINMENKLKRDL